MRKSIAFSWSYDKFHLTLYGKFKKMARNRRILSYLFPVLMFMAGIVCLSSCGEFKSGDSESRRTVVVLHSWSDMGEEGEYFRKCMEKAFKVQKLNVDVRHLYLDMLHRPADVFTYDDWEEYSDSIRKWKPEVILMNDDPIVEWVLKHGDTDSVLVNTPVVFAGVSALLSDSLPKFPLMTGIKEYVDLGRNMGMFMTITRGQCVFIELDHGRFGDRMRTQLYNQIADSTRYVNNGDFHLPTLDTEYLSAHFPGMAVVNFISCADPSSNHPVGGTPEMGRAMTKAMYQRARNSWHMQVKYDLYSNSLIDYVATPQFTCIREQFNDPRHPIFLGGFFTSTETQVQDQVDYAAQIMRGQSPVSLPITQHSGEYYLDWNAMQLTSLNISYNSYKNFFHIINAPMHLEQPVLYWSLVALGVLVVLFATYWIVRHLLKWRNKGQQDLLDDLQFESKVQSLLFSDTKDTLWSMKNGTVTFSKEFAETFRLHSRHMTIEEVKAAVHPESQTAYTTLLNFQNQRGKKVLRLRLTPDGTTWYWTEITYTATEETARTGEIYGLLQNIDHKIHIEEKLKEAQILANQVAVKEDFLAAISHDLRTPLNAVTGFSVLLTMPGMVVDDEEREQYGSIIHENTDMILKMIDDVMEQAQTESTDLKSILRPVSVQQLVNDCYNTNYIIAPSYPVFLLQQAEPDVIVNIDMTRTKQVINNFLSNAFKFTTEGSITLGWRYVEGTDQIEVYVQDTGIGVKPEKQATLFERYVKVNETDKGTGLGLNISKSIIEKQGGTIGVESEYGKGSKFFFRLAKYVQCLLLVLTMGVGLIMPSSCTQDDSAPMQEAQVLVVHTYGKDYIPYGDFNDQLVQTFKREGVSVTMKHMYLNLIDPTRDATNDFVFTRDSLDKIGWIPDVIMTEGDAAARQFLAWGDKESMGSWAHKLIVCGSVHHPDWRMVRRHRKIVVINDPIDYCANINLAAEMHGKNYVEMELDYFYQDSIIRNELREAILRPPYIDDTDYHLGMISNKVLTTDLKDSIVVRTISVASPENNVLDIHEEEDSLDAYAQLRLILLRSSLYPSVALKKDMYNSVIVGKMDRPQYTAVKEDFAIGDGRYLCGYFADYRTVGDDMAVVASEVLKGAEVESYAGVIHEKKYYMDYHAMERLGLDYDDYKGRFVIVGAPIQYTMPVVYYGTWVVVAIMFIGAVFSVLLIIQSWRDRHQENIISNLKRSVEMRDLALQGADSHSVRTESNVKELLARIHTKYLDDIPKMMQDLDVRGLHSYEIYADIEGDGNYRWWQLRFIVVFDEKGKKRVDGILVNMDEVKKFEEDLRKALHLVEEANQKKEFLAAISQEIRIPLNAVVGFSDLLISMPSESFSEEELADYAKAIKANNATLATMIEDILMFSRIESGRIKYINDDFDAASVVTELASEWRDIMPDCISLNTFTYHRGVTINNDRARLKYILNQFVNNAVKFTKKGAVTIGVTYQLNTDKVVFWVEDTGCGIPAEKVNDIFELFWKSDPFAQGLGLGLNLVKRMAEGMNLEVRVESKVGIGTRISILADGRLADADIEGEC